jgi:DNA-binding HxlR family transcriptional regulator
MASRADLSTFNCSLARAVDVVGDPWALLVLREVLMGASTFTAFQRALGVARNILSDRLQRLVRHGVLRRAGSDARPSYELTDKGRALTPALVALMQWGDVWESGGKPPVELRDAQGREIAPVVVRGARGRAVAVKDLRFVAGPGADARTRARIATSHGAKARPVE